MDPIPSSISPATIIEVTPPVNAAITGKFNEFKASALKEVEENRDAWTKDPYSKGMEIGTKVFEQLTNWANEEFPSSPEKEIAAALLIARSNHIKGIHGFPKQVIDILLNKDS